MSDAYDDYEAMCQVLESIHEERMERLSKGLWKTKQGKLLKLVDMTTDHLVAAYNMFGYPPLRKEIERRAALGVES